MKLACWYHAWVNGAWAGPVLEHAETLRRAEFAGPVYLGLVGQRMWREAVVDAFAGFDVHVAVEAESGWEQPTIRALSGYAKENAGAIMYAHTKGAGENTDFRAKWRRSMNLRVVDNWRSNLDALSEVDAVGCHWLTPEEHPNTIIDTPFFGGNYWIARCDYLASLPECKTEDRFQAERWIGLGNPKVLDLNPGWPSEALF